MKKSLLAVSGLLVSGLAYAELVQLEDDELTSVVAQDGVDIQLDVSATVGEVVYVDTANNGDGDGGALSFQDISIGGAGRVDFFGYQDVLVSSTDNLDDINIQVDALENGELEIQIYPINGDFVDFKYEVDNVELLDINNNPTANLFSDLSVSGLIQRVDLYVYETLKTLPDNSVLEQVSTDFTLSLAVDQLDVDVANSSLTISGGFICGENCIETMGDPASNVADKMASISGVFRADSSVVSVELDNLVLDLGADRVTLGGPNDELGSFMINDLSVKDITISVKGKD